MLKSKSSTACLLAYISPSFVFYSRFGGTINKAAQCYCPQALSRTGTLWEEQELGLPQVSLQGCRPRENLWTVLLSRPEKEKKKPNNNWPKGLWMPKMGHSFQFIMDASRVSFLPSVWCSFWFVEMAACRKCSVVAAGVTKVLLFTPVK